MNTCTLLLCNKFNFIVHGNRTRLGEMGDQNKDCAGVREMSTSKDDGEPIVQDD